MVADDGSVIGGPFDHFVPHTAPPGRRPKADSAENAEAVRTDSAVHLATGQPRASLAFGAPTSSPLEGGRSSPSPTGFFTSAFALSSRIPGTVFVAFSDKGRDHFPVHALDCRHRAARPGTNPRVPARLYRLQAQHGLRLVV